MADISKIKLESTTYDIKDSTSHNMGIYSTTETAIGKWTDDSTIYRKVITGTTGSNDSPKNMGTISNVNNVINIYGTLISSLQRIPLNFVYNTAQNSLYVESGNIMLRTTASSYQSKNVIIIIEYTKTI